MQVQPPGNGWSVYVWYFPRFIFFNTQHFEPWAIQRTRDSSCWLRRLFGYCWRSAPAVDYPLMIITKLYKMKHGLVIQVFQSHVITINLTLIWSCWTKERRSLLVVGRQQSRISNLREAKSEEPWTKIEREAANGLRVPVRLLPGVRTL